MTATTQQKAKERPILFSGSMVRAVLDGRKTQTRRIVDRLAGIGSITEFGQSNTPGYDWHCRDKIALWNDFRNDQAISRCPYGTVGDRLWVRETWFCATGEPGPTLCHYRADCDQSAFNGLWQPSIHMPRWASRIKLEITDVRIERLNEISPEDVAKEGIELNKPELTIQFGVDAEARSCFADVWDAINGQGAWNKNPFVWVIAFRRLEDA